MHCRCIPGIPFMRDPASRYRGQPVFKPMPRGPVKFRENPDFVPLRSLAHPLAPLPPRPVTPAPRRPVLHCPRLPPPRPRSPPRYNGWDTPSMSKSGVSKAPINRPLPMDPPPSRIPVLVRSSKAFSTLKVSSRPQSRLSDSSEGSVSRLSTPCKLVRPAVATLSTPPPPRPATSRLSWLEDRCAARQDRPRPWLPKGKSATTPTTARPPTPSARPTTRVSAKSSTRQAETATDSILVWPGSFKEKPVKRVRFGDVTVHEVDFWIDRQRDVHRDGAWAFLTGRLQGWRVTPRAEPDDEGETDKYMTMWGHDHSSLYYHSADRPCANDGCAWNTLARIKRRWQEKAYRGWDRSDVFAAWLAWRQRIRDRGGFAL
ncbi:hypothetical protein VTN77DRAFT_6910 [Rasamsonia byssochlamydoides]|uniref:uncharacterized protein n=1 Tax=Rasamsonia byssochlamydoides TaxID=89139 RepID=UPI003741F83C